MDREAEASCRKVSRTRAVFSDHTLIGGERRLVLYDPWVVDTRLYSASRQEAAEGVAPVERHGELVPGVVVSGTRRGQVQDPLIPQTFKKQVGVGRASAGVDCPSGHRGQSHRSMQLGHPNVRPHHIVMVPR